jgi:hypothetical protein
MKPQQTLEERLMQLYDLTQEQAVRVVELLREIAIVTGGAAPTQEAIHAALKAGQQRAIYFEDEKPALPAHKYERPRLPSQQGYNRTPYDHWRNNLGKRRGKRKL